MPLVINALAGLILVAPARLPNTQEPVDAPPAFTRVCGNCHTVDRVVATRRSRDQWQEVVENMISRGAKGTDEEFATVMEFLVTHVGRVNVNRAPADELVEVLAVTVADAQKVAEYRKAHGPFADMDALTAVPGIDVDKFKARRDAIAF